MLLSLPLEHDGESLDQAVEVVVTVEILVIRGGPAQSIADPVMGIGNAVYLVARGRVDETGESARLVIAIGGGHSVGIRQRRPSA
ncbi:MAG: hypothetical protein AABY41_02095 [Nitrospirota bacterium]